jgi:hypothetical protein
LLFENYSKKLKATKLSSTQSSTSEIIVVYSNLKGFSNPDGLFGKKIISSVLYTDKFQIDIEFLIKTTSSSTSQNAQNAAQASSQNNVVEIPADNVILLSQLPNKFKIENITPSTVRLTGDCSSMFDDYYEFVFPDGSVKRASPDTTEQYVSLVKYKMPSTVELSFQYDFEVSKPLEQFNTDSVFNNKISLTQKAYWNTNSASINISNCTVKGTS